MTRRCDGCRRAYTAQRSSRGFARRGAAAGITRPAVPAHLRAPREEPTAVYDARRAELDQLDTSRGQLLLVTTSYLDRETSARGLVALSREAASPARRDQESHDAAGRPG